MKTKLLLSVLFTFIFYLLSSQVPQGFNYQAIARDGSGNPIVGATIKVKLSILTDTAGFRPGMGGTYVWEEEHTGVVTNAYGLFTVVLGDLSATYVQGVASFSLIDWNKPKLFIGTKIANPTDYKPLGGAKLWSVPYSLISGNLSGPVKKLAIKSLNTSPDSAIFEVKNNLGQTVFAVYNEGVRVYVDDGAKGITKGGFAIGSFGTDKTPSKSLLIVNRDSIRAYVDTSSIGKGITKGGFAIGGFGTEKASPQEYFRVTRDSTRIYVNDRAGKGITKGGFAIGGFDTGKAGDHAKFFDVAPDATKTIFPSQKRILWYPLKNAFLTGKVIIEKPDSVGENSFASGFESKAIGDWSQALGYQAIARGDYSTAIGKNAVADTSSYSFGNLSRALRNGSYAFGSGAYALGKMSFAFGSVGIDSMNTPTGNTKATGDHSYSFGLGSLASGKGAFALGANDTASGEFSYAAGYKTKASKYYATSMGGYSQATGFYASAIGYKVKATGTSSTSMGHYSEATGPYSTALGYNTKATGFYSFAGGGSSKATGSNSTAFGNANIGSGSYSFAIGQKDTASGSNSFASGFESKATTSYTFVHGYQSVSSGQNSIAMGYQVKATGNYSFAQGRGTIASGIGSVALNNYSQARGMYSTAAGNYARAQAFSSFVIGRYNVLAGDSLNWVSSEPLFVAGIGTGPEPANRKNALSLDKLGNLWIFGALTQGSDMRWKENISPITGALNKIERINSVYFTFIDKETSPPGRQVGFLAQEVQEVLPEVVMKDINGYLSVDYGKMTVVLLQGIKEQQMIIEEQKIENTELKARLESLEKRMDLLQSGIMIK